MRSLRAAPFCERYFGGFLVLWGLLLQWGHFGRLPHGVLFSNLEGYVPGWAWGTFMIALGLARFAAYSWDANRLRLALSQVTLVLFWVIATVAVYSQLWAATAPLSCFVAVICQWCHGRLAREVSLGL